MSESYDAMWEEYQWDEESMAPEWDDTPAEPSIAFNANTVNDTFTSIFGNVNIPWTSSYTTGITMQWAPAIHDSYYLTPPASMTGVGATETDATYVGTYGAITRDE